MHQARKISPNSASQCPDPLTQNRLDRHFPTDLDLQPLPDRNGAIQAVLR